MIWCYTAIYGGYDVVRPAPPAPGVNYVCFTDNPDMRAPGWDIRVVPRPEDHPRMRAKWFKLLPHLALPEAERTLWVDASHEIKAPRAIEEALACVGPDGIAAHDHPRKCIYPEAVASTRYRKYDGQPVLEQAEHYRAEGHPEMWGLWACGSLARVSSNRLDRAMEDWWEENLRWTYQDQISFPVVMRRHGLRPASFPHNQYAPPWFAMHPHLSDD